MVEGEPQSRLRSCDHGITRAFAFLGKRWNGVIIGTLIDGPAGFAELARAITGISESMLADRLSELVAAGLVDRTVLPGPPIGVSYALTDRGSALAPVLEHLARWASDHLPDAPSLDVRSLCGASTDSRSVARLLRLRGRVPR